MPTAERPSSWWRPIAWRYYSLPSEVSGSASIGAVNTIKFMLLRLAVALRGGSEACVGIIEYVLL